MEYFINSVLLLSIIYDTISLSTPLTSPVRTLLDKKTDSLDESDLRVLGWATGCALLLYIARLWILSLYAAEYPIATLAVAITYGIMGVGCIYTIKYEGKKYEKLAATIGRPGFIISALSAGYILLDRSLL